MTTGMYNFLEFSILHSWTSDDYRYMQLQKTKEWILETTSLRGPVSKHSSFGRISDLE